MPEGEKPLPFFEIIPPAGDPSFWEFQPGIHIAWNEYGDPNGRVLFYYHGWPSSRLQARAIHQLALERRLRVIALDRPGMGKSTLVRGRKLGDWAEVIRSFAEAHGIGRFAQLGVSGGGPYVLPCAMAMPDRVAGSAVLCGAVPLGPDCPRDGLHPIYRTMLRLIRLPAACFTPAFRIAGGMARMDLGKPPLSWIMATLPEADRSVLRHNPRVVPVFVASFEEGIRQGGPGVMSDAAVYLNPWPEDLAEIRIPIRYWHGAEDHNIPVHLVEKLTAAIPSADLTVDPDEGHFSLALNRATDAMDYLAACLNAPGVQ